MNRIQRSKLVRLLDAEAAFGLLGEYAGLFGDNGGDPDGAEWLRPVDDFPPELVQELLGEGVAEIVNGYVIRGYYGPDPMVGPGDWCGYAAEGVAYALSRRAAEFVAHIE